MNSSISNISFDNLSQCTSLCNSIGASTEDILWSDDDTIVVEQEHTWHNNLTSIKKLCDFDQSPVECQNCNMPFDKGKRRRLIDNNCGHELCYTCMTTNESCPLCNREKSPPQKRVRSPTSKNEQPTQQCHSKNKLGRSDVVQNKNEAGQNKGEAGQNKSEAGQNKGEAGQNRSEAGQNKSDVARSKSASNQEKIQKSFANFKRPSLNIMTQSCPTPSHSRRKLFSPKMLRKPASTKQNSTDQVSGQMSLSTTSADGRHWSSKVLGKIRSLWSSGSSGASAGLNQLLTDSVDGLKVQPENNVSPRLDVSIDEESGYSTVPFQEPIVRNEKLYTSNSGSQSTDNPFCNNMGLRSLIPGSIFGGSILNLNLEGNNMSNRSSQIYETISSKNVIFRRLLSLNNNQQLTLKPLFFEVSVHVKNAVFIGRKWLFDDIKSCVESPTPGILISGNPGSGKTTIILQLVEASCFGRSNSNNSCESNPNTSSPPNLPTTNDGYIKYLAGSVVAYHFCQADNSSTCFVPDFIHSLAAQLCQSQITAYRDHLLKEPQLQDVLSLKNCITNPDVALRKGIIDPLNYLMKIGKIECRSYLILIDAIGEAEYHKPDHGETVTSFLVKHITIIPSWLKFIITVRSQLKYVCKGLPFKQFSLDVNDANGDVQMDLEEYINFRKDSGLNLPTIATINGKIKDSLPEREMLQNTLVYSDGSFLYIKLCLDSLSNQNLDGKGSKCMSLPQSLAQIYFLYFNLRFPTIHSYEKVKHILCVCLASLSPLTLLEIFFSVNALHVDEPVTWSEFLERFKLLSGFIVKRSDSTYMFFHPSFREWLIRRDENESTKYLCDLRVGHIAIALRLSRMHRYLDPEKTLELSHHLLKAHVSRYFNMSSLPARDFQAYWISESSENVSEALCHLRNIFNPNVKVSKLLLSAGSCPDYRTCLLKNSPLLCVFASEGIVPMVSLLLEFGADVELANEEGFTPLMFACSNGHCDVVRQIIAAGASPGHVNSEGSCALLHAASNGFISIVRYLLACEWKSKTTNDISRPDAIHQALFASTGKNQVELVEFLLDSSDISADSSDVTGENLLTLACRQGCLAVCAALINRGANVLAENKKKECPLILSVKKGHQSVAELLIENGADVNQSDNMQRTALIYATVDEKINVMDFLLEKGANIEYQDSEGLTPLCWACLRGRLHSVHSLLNKGANLNHADKSGRTPLSLASCQDNAAVVELLLERGAIIDHVDGNGMRPLDIAIGNGNVAILHIFLKNGSKLSPITWTIAVNYPEIILVLLNKLLENGNNFYRRNQLKEANHYYKYGLKKFPAEDNVLYDKPFRQLKINFLLNYSRCKRKLFEHEEAIECANKVLSLKPRSYEAFYARAKAKMDLKRFREALVDIQEAIDLSPLKNIEVHRTLEYLKGEITKSINKDK